MRANLFAALIGMLCVAGCGGGNGLYGRRRWWWWRRRQAPPATFRRSSSIRDRRQSRIPTKPAINTAYTTVTVCAPGSTSNCQTIDHIQVDTGSSGLRILSEVLTITLPVQKDTAAT